MNKPEEKKIYIDVDLAVEAYNEKNQDAPINKTQLADMLSTNLQNLINYHAGRTPQILHTVFMIKVMTGLSIDELIKEKK